MSMQSARRRATQTVDQHIANREDASIREKVRLKKEKPPFLICPRVRLFAAEKVMPWYKKDRCRGCGEEVWYDSVFAGPEIPHVCAACVAEAQEGGSFYIDALDPMRIEKRNLNDQQQYERIMKSIAQNRAGEHKRER